LPGNLTSVRRRLLVGLTALALTVDGLAGLLAYRRALVSTGILLDYQLQQMALSLRSQGEPQPDVPITPQSDGSDFVIQIWNKDGTPIYNSRPEVRLGHDAAEGYMTLQAGGDSWRAFSMHTPRRVILVAQLSGIRHHLARSIAVKTVAPLLILTPLLAIAIWFIVVRTLEPIKRAVVQVRSRDADSLLPLAVADLPQEIEPLVAEFNRLLERLAAAFKVQRSFIADAAHELRSPLAALRLQVQLFSGARDEAEREEIRQKIIAAVDRAGMLVQQLLTLARNEPGAATTELGPLSLSATVQEAISECADYAISRGTDIAFEPEADVDMVGNAESLRMLARNLVDNAVRYTPANGKVLVRLSESRDEAILEVEDSGPGLAAIERERVFQRFYRGHNSPESGTGLGLAIVSTITQRHRGTVRLDNASMGGLKVSVRLPKRGSPRGLSQS
jgi:signal transduction histidine kinase